MRLDEASGALAHALAQCRIDQQPSGRIGERAPSATSQGAARFDQQPRDLGPLCV